MIGDGLRSNVESDAAPDHQWVNLDEQTTVTGAMACGT
jgi:hypothetical protein